ATLPATCACLMVARAKDAQSGSAGLLLQTSGGGHGLVLRIDGEGVVFVTAWDPSVKPPLTLITRIKHPAVRSAGEDNTLVAIVRGRMLELYVNGLAVHDPLKLDQDLAFGSLHLTMGSRNKESEAVLTRLALWPADNRPTLEERAAKVMP